MKSALALAGFAIVCIAWAAGPQSSLAGNGHSITSVNGSVKAAPGETYDSVSTVNGDVRVGSGATVDSAHAVNGEIEIEDNARVGEAKTVNGELRLGEGAAVERGATTVNGEIHLSKGARVGGDVRTVSGEIEIEGAEVGGDLNTYNGDIELTAGAHVRGGIIVKKSRNNGWNWGNDKPPKIRICATCIVDGDLRFERAVDLKVETGAKIGKVIDESSK
ncbi:MAG TPA: polymer-forming cytoskeletal protein [Steroidobacteraceae bacterium]|nr:polymer-forming cytoskeletal protein [Steroidobacteraceae bacterium]